jgi:SAM-dependent methyltransferase
MPRPYLDFYSELNIIPVRQDMRDLSRHFARRNGLYAQLGLLPGLVRGRTVLEIGPGTGDNAVHTASLEPSRYVMVDGNPASIDALNAKVDARAFGDVPVEIKFGDIEHVDDSDRYDVVLCEGLLHAQTAPGRFLESVAARVAKHGVIVITTVSYTSIFAETCRRALLPWAERGATSSGEVVRRLVAFFAPDLGSLRGMSRLHEDWVVDQIIHPYTKQHAFTLEDAMNTLGDEFLVAGTSPRVLQDWRWYKAIPESERTQREIFRDEASRWSVGMIDYRREPTPCDPDLGREIEAIAKAAWETHMDVRASPTDSNYRAFWAKVRAVREKLPEEYAETSNALDDYLEQAPRLIGGAPVEFRRFHTLFGRGQQYLMMMRG